MSAHRRTSAALDPWTDSMVLDASSSMRTHCYADRFSAVRVETTGALADAISMLLRDAA